MTIVGTKPGTCATSQGSPTPAERAALRSLEQRFQRLPACSFCKKSSTHVTFVITDPANRNNICESCADECVRRFAITCAC
jgi:hypothetical protein